MSSTNASGQRRSYGTGSLYVRADRNGRETWYAKFYVNGRRVKRSIGPKRAPGSRDGLSQTQAEAELRRLIADTDAKPRSGQRLTVEEVAARYITYAERRGRKKSTTENIESEARVHLEPFFRGRPVDAITPEDVLDLVAALEGKGLAPKTIKNVVNTLSALFNFAKAPRRRWATANPCDGLELPAVPHATEIRFLTLDEVEALVASARPGMFQALDRAMFLTAAMTGLRKGELLALRWRDVDWPAGRIRVRQNYVRGEFGTPKSKRSTRSVPMADQVGGELERLFPDIAVAGRRRSRVRPPGDRRAAAEGERHPPDAVGVAGRGARRRPPLPRSAPHVRDPDGGGRRAAAHLAGVDGPPRPRDDSALRRLRAQCPRSGDGRRRVRPWSRSWSQSERTSDDLREPIWL
jgi:integrase